MFTRFPAQGFVSGDLCLVHTLFPLLITLLVICTARSRHPDTSQDQATLLDQQTVVAQGLLAIFDRTHKLNIVPEAGQAGQGGECVIA